MHVRRSTIVSCFIAVILLNGAMIHAHDLRTLKGTTVTHSHPSDGGWAEYPYGWHTAEWWTAFADAYWEGLYEERLARANKAYNCHAFAFAGARQDYSSSYTWLNTPADNSYWNDGSYVETTASNAFIANYGDTKDHSLIFTGNTIGGEYEMKSKWGKYPVYRHKLWSDPYNAGPSDTKYYKPYSLSGTNYMSTMVVPVGRTLTVLAGATIKMYGWAEILVDGTLTAVGTSSNYIRFTCYSGYDRDSWEGIVFSSGSNDASRLEYCWVKYGDRGVYLDGAEPYIINSKFKENNYGLYYNSVSTANPAIAKIDGNKFLDNYYAGIKLVSSNPTINSCEFSSVDDEGDPQGDGIRVYSSSNPKISNNTFDENGTAIDVSSSSPNIDGNTITNNHEGIVAYSMGTSGTIQNNMINNNDDRDPVTLDNSSPLMHTNTITYNRGETGIKAENYSSPDLAASGRNIIAYNGMGIEAYNNSDPYLGGCAQCHGSGEEGKNSVYSNSSYELHATSSSNILALGTYWGTGATFYSDGTSSVDHSYPLTSDPNSGRPLQKGSPLQDEWEHPPISEFSHGQLDEYSGNYSAAIDHYQAMVGEENASSSERIRALVHLDLCYQKAGLVGLENYLGGIMQKHNLNPIARTAQELSTAWYWKSGQISTAFENLRSLRRNYNSNPDVVKRALYAELVYHLHDNNYEQAEQILSEMKHSFRNDSVTLRAMRRMGEKVTAEQIEISEALLRKELAIPDHFALHSAYPNPFNPSTTIHCDLPEASRVSLVIYDMLGREVRRWDLQEPPGYRQVMWDGKYQNGQLAPTGIYIYRLTAASVESDERFMASRKMLLMK